MPPLVETCEDDERAMLDRRGHCRLGAAAVLARLDPGPEEWRAFAASWDDLPLDTFMADGGRYRRRRFATYAVGGGTIRAKPPVPHFQTIGHNPLNGGRDRHFAPIVPAVEQGRLFARIVAWATATFARPAVTEWHLEAHQFRITATAGAPGLPTPEGLHRDGVDGVLMLMVACENVAGGVTTITDRDGRPLDRFAMTAPLDACLVDDHRVRHAVSAVTPADPARPAHRDALVLTFRADA